MSEIKPYYIIIRGPLGIGKSTISKKLAEVLDAKVFHMDHILQQHGLDQVAPGAESISAQNFIKAFEIIQKEIEEALTSGKIVIFDACFYHQENITDMQKKLDWEQKVFTLKAPLETCIKRDSQRKVSYGEDAARAVHNLVSRFDAGIMIETQNKSIAETVQEILGFL